MKKNRIISSVLVWLLFSSLLPLTAQSLKKPNQDLVPRQIISQLEQYPEDLYDIQVKKSRAYNNTFKPGEFTHEGQPDSVVLYIGSSLFQRETYVYDAFGELQTYILEFHNGNGWQYSEMKSYSFNEKYQLTNVILQSWIGFYWEKTHQLNYTYDFSGNLETYLVQNWEEGKWNNYNLITYNYNQDGEITTYLQQGWTNSSWINMDQVTNNFDEDGNLIYSFREVWFGETWVNSSRNTNTYNIRGNILTSVSQFWFNSAWENAEFHSFVYDDSENMISHLHMLYGGEWINYMIYSYTYDIAGNNTVYSEQQWDNGEWTNRLQITRSFDALGNVLTELNQEWMNTWNNVSNTHYEYDDSGNCQTYTAFYWNDNQWMNYSKVDYTYGQGIIEGMAYNWDGNGWINGDAWINLHQNVDGEMYNFLDWWGSKATVYYSAFFTNITVHDGGDNLIMDLYPVPAKDKLTVNYRSDMPGRIRLFNITGKMITTYEVNGEPGSEQQLSIPVNNLPSGVYFVELSNGKETVEQKISIIK